jgi:hypothetical protein
MIVMRTFVMILFVFMAAFSHAQTLLTEEQQLEKWLPSQVGEYVLDGAPMTITSRVEDKPYIMSSKNFKKERSTLGNCCIRL